MVLWCGIVWYTLYQIVWCGVVWCALGTCKLIFSPLHLPRIQPHTRIEAQCYFITNKGYICLLLPQNTRMEAQELELVQVGIQC